MSSLLVFPTIVGGVGGGASKYEKLKIGRIGNVCGLTKITRRSVNSKLGCKCQLGDLAPATSSAYGVLLLGGGLFAFGRSRSKGSLFGGLTGGTLMAAAYFLMQTQETKALGDALGFGSAFLFSCVFGIRLAATKKLTPAGPLLALSAFALAVFLSAYLQDNI